MLLPAGAEGGGYANRINFYGSTGMDRSTTVDGGKSHADGGEALGALSLEEEIT